MPDDDRSARDDPRDSDAESAVDPEAVTRIAGSPPATPTSDAAPARTRVLHDDPAEDRADRAEVTHGDEPTRIAASRATGASADGRPDPDPEPDPDAKPDPDRFAEAETMIRPRAASPDAGSDAREGARSTDEEAAETGPSVPRTPVEAASSAAEVAAPPVPSTGIAPGSVLFGEYEVIEVLGAGGMGEVYRARHRRLGEFRAIKMMHAELATKQGANEFFLREAKALLAVRHPAVVHCHDLLSDEQGRIFLVMEMIEGVSLGERLADGPLPADQVVLLGARLAAGLQAAHACGVVHRDVSPDNVVLPDGDVENAKLIDFGIAKILEEGQGTIVDGFKGKLSYASPEQLGFFGGQIDGRSDFYSLGLVLCAAALGRPMGMGTTVVEAVDARRGFQHVPDAIPVGLRSALEPLLALDPRDRPQNVERLFLAPGGHQPGLDAIRRDTGAAPSDSLHRARIGPLRLAAAAGAIALGAFGYWLYAGGSLESPVGGGADATIADSAQTTPKTPPAAVRATAPGADAETTRTAEASRPAQPSGPSALDQVRIVGLMRGAEAALAENRLQSPPGDNAYEKYRAVQEIDPDNEGARLGLVAVAGRYIALSERALAKSDLELARSYLARASAIAPHHPDLEAAREALDAAGSP